MSRSSAGAELLVGAGAFDLPAPALEWLDAQAAAVLPATPRLVLWGVIGAVISMGLYRLVSPQRRIAEGKRDMAAARRRLDGYDGDLAGAMPLIRALLGSSLSQVGRVAGPAVAASLPLLCLLAWLSTAYGYSYPASGTEPRIHTQPGHLEASWEEGSGHRPPRVLVVDERRGVVADVVLGAPVPVLHKRQWWNALFGNPAGYLPDAAEVERIRIELPRRRYLETGPAWMQGWEATFFVSLLVASIALKVVARIE